MTEGGNQRDSDLKNEVLWAAVKKTALIAPSPVTILKSVGGLVGANEALTKLEASLGVKLLTGSSTSSDVGAESSATDKQEAAWNAHQKSSIGKALFSWIMGLPTAYALTRVQCEYQEAVTDAAGGTPNYGRNVEVTVTFWRAPRMPFVSGLLWSLHALKKINDTVAQVGLSSLVKFDMDYMLYSGFKTSSPLLDNLKTKLDDAHKEFSSAIGDMRKRKADITEVTNLVKGLSGSAVDMIPSEGSVSIPYLGDQSASSSKLNEFKDSIKSGIAEKTDHVSGAVGEKYDRTLDEIQTAGDSLHADASADASKVKATAQKALNDLGSAVSGVVLSVPHELRLIPISSKVRLMIDGENVSNANEKWDGKAYMIGPFTADASADRTQKMWAAFARRIAERAADYGEEDLFDVK